MDTVDEISYTAINDYNYKNSTLQKPIIENFLNRFEWFER